MPAALAAPAAAESTQGAAAPPSGGARATIVPDVRSVTCARKCTGSGSVRSARSRPHVHAGSVLRIKGQRLHTVQKVVFLGARGSRDDVLVSPRRTSRTSVDVVVPKTAAAGPIVVTTDDGSSSKRRPRVQVHRHAPPPPPPTAADSSAGEALIWPVRGQITGRFGENRGSHYHSGLDISAPGGTPIKAAAAGRVIHQGWYGGYGNYTCVAHVTITTCYAHQSRYAAGIAKDASVTQGQVIGYVGNTGRSSGNHLHFEVRKGLAMGSTPVDPMQYLP